MVFARNFFNKIDAEASYLGDASGKTTYLFVASFGVK
jgi:hypothetical protein